MPSCYVVVFLMLLPYLFKPNNNSLNGFYVYLILEFLRMSYIYRLLIIILGCSLIAMSASGQATLPVINAATTQGINIISWINPYENGIKSIAVQRSADSNYNFSTIGIVPNVKKGQQSFVDPNPMIGKNWYRLVIVFTSETDWKSDLAKVMVDSAEIANRKPLPPSDSLQKIINNTTANTANNIAAVEAINSAVTTVTLPKSQYVFTNPFTGNINIEVSDALQVNYTLLFFDKNKKQILKIPRLNDKSII
jgi:hypothetical protein